MEKATQVLTPHGHSVVCNHQIEELFWLISGSLINRHVPPLGLWNFHQLVKELMSAVKIFIECPYDFASGVRYIVNVRKFESVKKMCHPCDFASDTPMLVPTIHHPPNYPTTV